MSEPAERAEHRKRKVGRLLEIYDTMVTDPDNHIDNALYALLNKYRDSLHTPDNYFHKAFRQCDVTDNVAIDCAIWNLIHASELFWEAFNQVNIEIPEPTEVS